MRSVQPRAVFSNWRTGRASKNSLATSSSGPSGTSSKRACQVGLIGGEGLALQGVQLLVDLDEMEIDGGMEARHAARGAQGIGHQGAASRSKLDQPHAGWASHRQPALGQPGAQKLAEHLGDFRRRGEVAGGADGQRLAVVAQPRMAQRLGHEVGERDRAGERDASGDQPAELRGHDTAGRA